MWPHRDRAEIAMMRAALDRRVPVLGICRGMQLLNVVCGGTLQQHLADVLDDASPHKAAPGTFARHPVEIEPGTRLRSILDHAPGAHSCHHQAPDLIGDGLTVSARAADGVVEGLELREHPFAVGVLWHPEEDPADGAALFRRAGRGRGRVPGVPGRVAVLDGAVGGADRLDQLVEADALLQAVGRAGRERRFDHLRLIVG